MVGGKRDPDGTDGQDPSQRPVLLESYVTGTQTIDLNTLFTKDVTASGSFDVRGIKKTSFGKLLESLPIPALLIDRSQVVVFTNRACEKLTPDTELYYPNFNEFFPHQLDAQEAQRLLHKVFSDRREQIMECSLGIAKARMWGRIHMRSLRLGDERSVLALVEDLTAEKKQVVLSKRYSEQIKKAHDQLEIRVQERTAELAKANEQLRAEIDVRMQTEEDLRLADEVIASSNEAILITDAKGKIIRVNDAFCRITGYSEQEVLWKNPKIMGSGKHGKDFWTTFWESLTLTGQWRGEVWDRRKNGEIFPKFLSVSAIKNHEQKTTHYVGIFSDITREKESEEKLEQLAHYDPLTGLPNRLLFRDRIKHAIDKAERSRGRVAVIFLDLDGFKSINDTRGHRFGDELLKMVADRLIKVLRRGDTVSRVGGDEFTVIMEGPTELSQIGLVSQRIVDTLSRPYYLQGSEVFISASLGVSLHPDDGGELDRLVQNADTAMYYAKSKGGGNFQFFAEEMNAEMLQTVELETTLRRSMERNDFLLYYQPIVNLRTFEVVGAEALLRFRTRDGSVSNPEPYIKVAEEKGLIVPLGDWVLRKACQQSKLWRDRYDLSVQVAVNVSMRQLREPGIVESITRILEQTGLDPQFLELEATETAMMSDPESTIQVLNEFKELGIRLAIDDFGTGYSSLSHLKRLPIDKIKIDKSFIDDITYDSKGETMLEAIIALAHSMGVTVVAEGVEKQEQLQFLSLRGCDQWQGYLFSPPVPGSRFEQIVAGGNGGGSRCS